MATVHWGKHEGMKLEDLVKSNPAYAKWYALKCYPTKNHDDWVVISDLMDLKTMYIDFGKYRNQTAEYVIEHDPKYANWIVDNMSETRSSLVQYIREHM